MAINVEENLPQPLSRSDAEDDEIPPGILEAAQDFIADESNRWSRNSDGAGSELDLDSVGVHFKPLDVILTNCRISALVYTAVLLHLDEAPRAVAAA